MSLCDPGLPDGTGIDLIRNVRETRQTPAIALTGFSMREDVDRAQKAGFDAHLTKPVNLQKLEATMWRLPRPDRCSFSCNEIPRKAKPLRGECGGNPSAIRVSRFFSAFPCQRHPDLAKTGVRSPTNPGLTRFTDCPYRVPFAVASNEAGFV
jgi:CheY-like chemotaxis protein